MNEVDPALPPNGASTLARRTFLRTAAGAAGAVLAEGALPGGVTFAQPADSRAWSDAKRVASHLIALPKSGGAVSGIGEAFVPDLRTGTEGIRVPLPLTKGRAGFGPQMGLSYSVANGNGIFGMGWKLDLPEITRRTQGGLPQYTDDDVFLLDGDELRVDVRRPPEPRGFHVVYTYLLRHEGPFSRIERWTAATGSFWRVTSKDNVTQVFGASAEAQVAAPPDDQHAPRVFRWLLELSHDGVGNVVHYLYKREDDAGAPPEDLGRRVSQTYLKRIRYGNLGPLVFSDPVEERAFLWRDAPRTECFFEAVFDYGEHGEFVDGDAIVSDDIHIERRPWDWRRDAFSSFRSRFEIRTRRWCKRFLMFHGDPDSRRPTLVASMDFQLEPPPREGPGTVTRLLGLTRRGYAPSRSGRWNESEDYEPHRGVGVRSRSYSIASIPPLQFDYTEFEPPRADDLRRLGLDKPGVEPDGALGGNVALVDLFQRGLPDILETNASGYCFWKNLGGGRFESKDTDTLGRRAPAGAGAREKVVLANAAVGFGEVSGDEFPDLLIGSSPPGYCLGEIGALSKGAPRWRDYQPFTTRPPFDLTDRNIRFLDLTGDGRLDVLRWETTPAGTRRLAVFASRGRDGFEQLREIPPLPLKGFPDLDLDNPRVHFADMTGDGLSDVVVIDTTQIHYWPNLGFGEFGPRITMGNSPQKEFFQPERLYFADVDGTGPCDLIYVSAERVQVWLNRAGNEWTEPIVLPLQVLGGPPQLVDLVGDGMMDLLWSNGGGLRNWRYLPLSRRKPCLLERVKDNMGKRVEYRYEPSTRFALESEKAGRPWTERLPFPVYVLSRVERHDEVANSRRVSLFCYAHGFYDSEEKEFRGFGRVDQVDTEYFSSAAPYPSGDERIPEDLHQAPVLTRTWFHTGRHVEGSLVRRHAGEYYAGDPNGPSLPDTELPQGLPAGLAGAVNRALAGRLLRTEVYELGRAASELLCLTPPVAPHLMTEHRFVVRQLQGGGDPALAAFLVYEDQTLDVRYEGDPGDPQASHQILLKVDDLGHVTESAAVAYPRRRRLVKERSGDRREPEQDRPLATYTKRRYCDPAWVLQGVRHGTVCEEQTFELLGLVARMTAPLTPGDVLDWLSTARWLEFDETPQDSGPHARLIDHARSFFFADDGVSVLPARKTGLRALRHTRYALAFSPGLLRKIYGTRVVPALAREGGYDVDAHGAWWVPSGDPNAGEHTFDTSHFCLPVQLNDAFGQSTAVSYDPFWLAVTETRDPLGNVTKAELDYRALLPRVVEDPNGNRTHCAFDALGRLVGTAVAGKATEQLGDSLRGFDPNLDYAAITMHANDPRGTAPALLADATTRAIYDLWRSYPDVRRPHGSGQPAPAAVCTLARETHTSDTGSNDPSRIQQTFVYFDGFGREIQTKKPAAPGRWVGTGATVYDNKGNPIKKYEPFFSGTHRFEPESVLTKSGVALLLRYDALGRLVRTDLPDGSLTRTVYKPWRQEVWDELDTIPEGTWYGKQMQTGDPATQRAADLARRHANTPTIVDFDGLQRVFLSVSDNGPLGRYAMRTALDIQGNLKVVTDARGNRTRASEFDMLKRALVTWSIDGGERMALPNVVGNPMRGWDGAGHETHRVYDHLQRPTELLVRSSGGPERLVERTVYGEAVARGSDSNLRGRPYRQYDEAGVVTNAAFDFKGNVELCTRHFWRRGHVPEDGLARLAADGDPGPASEADIFSRACAFDALNRPLTVEHGDGTAVACSYDEGGHTKSVRVRIGSRGSFEPQVADTEHNARGQCRSITYGKGLRTEYTYDPSRFRLKRLATRGANGTVLQDLVYTYDAVGNVLEMQDAAQPTVHFANQRIQSASRFEYDAVHRLVWAEGREHRGQGTAEVRGEVLAASFHPHDDNALRTYEERYAYDEVGNLRSVRHIAEGGGWTNEYQYAQDSNRLTAAGPSDEAGRVSGGEFFYDANGNVRAMPHLARLSWDHADRLRSVEGSGLEATYAYDVAGQRARKTVRRGATLDDQLDFQDLEVLWTGQVDGDRLGRRTLHVTCGGRRVSSVEWTADAAGLLLGPRTRYALCDHLGSVTLEVDAQGGVLAYEEYRPYGTSSYRATSSVDAIRKRFRYVGKELDEESGLYYFGARYYAPWLGRWTACDPLGLKDGPSPYAYVGNNPVRFTDRTGLSRQDEERASEQPTRSPARAEAQGGDEKAKPRTVMDLSDKATPIEGSMPHELEGGGWESADGKKRWFDLEGATIAGKPESRASSSGSSSTAKAAASGNAAADPAERPSRAPRADKTPDGGSAGRTGRSTIKASEESEPPAKSPGALETAASVIAEAVPIAGDVGSIAGGVTEALASTLLSVSTVLGSGTSALVGGGASIVGLGTAAFNMTARLGYVGKIPGRVMDAVGYVGDAASLTSATTFAVEYGALPPAAIYGGGGAGAAMVTAATCAVVGAAAAGWAIGRALDRFVLPEAAQDAIGGTVAETLENGWQNVTQFYF